MSIPIKCATNQKEVLYGSLTVDCNEHRVEVSLRQNGSDGFEWDVAQFSVLLDNVPDLIAALERNLKHAKGKCSDQRN